MNGIKKKGEKRVLLAACHSVIEPLSLLALSAVALEEKYNPKIKIVGDSFDGLEREIQEFRPDYLGFSLLTGSHRKVFDYLDSVKRNHPGVVRVLGGPHPSFFPRESLEHSEYVVLSEGFDSFRRILRNEVPSPPGIIHLQKTETFPIPDRKEFYSENSEYNNSPIKSVIASTGCLYSCAYCYNSSTIDNLEGIISETAREDMVMASMGKRMFPKSQRKVDDVIMEIQNIQRSSPTRMIYFQDDVFGLNLEWAKEFSSKYKSIIGLPFHCQMRFEQVGSNDKCLDRLKYLKDAGCTGITLAIESADNIVRKEVLHRGMDESLIYESMGRLANMGYKVRTEQMLGLPLGATREETPINLEADLKTLELNVNLRKETGLPTMAWASIFAPYRGTKIGEYCRHHGFYHGNNNDVPETFFQRSVLRFPRRWVGPELRTGMCESWLNEEEQEDYRSEVSNLRDLFSYFFFIPEGHKLAERFIKNKDTSYASLSKETRHFLYDSILYNVK